jgi:hypothetical protein
LPHELRAAPATRDNAVAAGVNVSSSLRRDVGRIPVWQSLAEVANKRPSMYGALLSKREGPFNINVEWLVVTLAIVTAEGPVLGTANASRSLSPQEYRSEPGALAWTKIAVHTMPRLSVAET